MAKVTDITTIPISGLNHIDALLDIGPDWNFLTGNPANTLYYTFSILTDNEKDRTGQVEFNATQQMATRTAFTYLQQVTGIQFVETNSGATAQIHLANLDIDGYNTTGLCSWMSSYLPGTNDSLVSYTADAYVYLDNVQWGGQNLNPVPGTDGYQTLLHELGHALGLGHPFHEETEQHNHIHLPASQDNTANTIMSYTHKGGPYSAFSPYDIAALNWLYGGDGLAGALGINSTGGGRYLTGASGNDRLVGTDGDDVFAGMGGNDTIIGGLGTDTVVFSGLRKDYTFSVNGNGDLIGAHASGTITMSGIDLLSFNDGRYQRADVVGSDVTPPPAPQLGVIKNAAGYAQAGLERKPVVSGFAEANSLVKIHYGDRVVAETRVDAEGVWQVATAPFPDGLNYSLRATATDAAGNTSAFSEAITFHIDSTPPVRPTATVTLAEGGNQPVFSGTGEAGTLMQLVHLGTVTEIGRTTVTAAGTWKIESPALPNGTYEVRAASVDKADNATTTIDSMQFTISNALNVRGTDGMDRFIAAAGNAAIDGGKGLDTVVYNSPSTDFRIERGVYGVTVTDRTGKYGSDNLIDVERIQFADKMVGLDIEGNVGQIYRLYRAAYDRVPDQDGLAFWIKAMDTGNYSLADIAGYFLADKEAQALYSTNPSDEYFITKMYHHVLHREPDGGGFQFYVDGLKLVTRQEVLAFFAESPENKAQVIGSIEHGIEFPLPVA